MLLVSWISSFYISFTLILLYTYTSIEFYEGLLYFFIFFYRYCYNCTKMRYDSICMVSYLALLIQLRLSGAAVVLISILERTSNYNHVINYSTSESSLEKQDANSR
ncbi:hypothetical protein F5Y14DRAFT_367396 [Nemania sp. NC0429]|nr:hypothetical protein F5Y14DRAFT_367396 [Nemania sp. NC0429]